MLYVGQTSAHVEALPHDKFHEVGNEDLIFTERDSRAAWQAIGSLCMDLSLFERLHKQATVLGSHRAAFLMNTYLQAFRDATPSDEPESDAKPVTYFPL